MNNQAERQAAATPNTEEIYLVAEPVKEKGKNPMMLSFNEAVSHLSGHGELQEYPCGVNDIFNEEACGMARLMQDEPRQTLLPLARRLVHTYCEKCVATRMEIDTRAHIQVPLARVLRRKEINFHARALEETNGPIERYIPIMESAEHWLNNPFEEANKQALGALESMKRAVVKAVRARDGNQTEEQASNDEVDHTFHTFLLTRMEAKNVNPWQFADWARNLLTELLEACPHNCNCSTSLCTPHGVEKAQS